MAKRASRRKTTASTRRIESKVVDYAEELGRLLGTVRARLHRGRMDLKDKMERFFP